MHIPSKINTEDTIDFDPIIVNSLRVGDGLVILKMPSQPCYTQRKEINKGVDEIPHYEIEFEISHGCITQDSLQPPFETRDWKVKSKSGSRMCFLPALYAESGSIILVFKHQGKTLEITGTAFKLRVVKHVCNSQANSVT